MNAHEREPAEERDAAGEDAHTPSTNSLSKVYWFVIGVVACLALIVGVAWVALLGWFVLRVLAWLFGTCMRLVADFDESAPVQSRLEGTR